MNRLLILFCVLIGLLAAGCNMFAPPAEQQTLAAQRDAAGTLVADARATATPAMDRLSVTAETAGTAVARSAAQSTRIAATLFALGTPFVDIRFITPQAPTQPAPLPGSGVLPGGGAPPAVLPTVIGQGSAQGNATLLAPPPVTPPPGAEATVDPSNPTGPALVNPIVTDRVGGDDCAVGNVTTFAPNALGVYIVATAQNIPAGTQFTARFLRDAAEQVFYTWSPSFNIANGCIWFYMPASDVAFTAGDWSAIIEMNGAAAIPAQPFTISGGETMPEPTSPA